MSEPPPDAQSPAGQGPRCPICGKPRVAEFKPFCSKRCANIDLSRWFKGGYAIPARDTDEGEGGAIPDPAGPGREG